MPWTNPELVSADTFAGLKKGDKVKVINPDGDSYLEQLLGLRFEFLWHTTNVANGKQWVTLWGGPTRHEAFVSVRPQFIVRVS